MRKLKKQKNKESFLFRMLSFFRVFSALFAVNFLFCFMSVSAQSKPTIRVSAETVIKSDRVTLGNIAEIFAASDETRERLKLISLGYAPSIGMRREIFKDKILLSIAAAGFTKNDFAFDAPAKIVVRREAQIVNQSVLREAVEKAILENFESGIVTAKIVRLDLPPNLQIPAGETKVRVLNVSNVNNLFAAFPVSLEILVDEQVVRRVTATVQIEATAEILVAAKDFSAGDKITETDVVKETRRLEKPLNNYLRDPKKLRGTVSLKNLSAGALIMTDSIVAGRVIRAGDQVRVVGESGKMQIIITGEARSSGRIGDRIAVKNSQSGTILQATVIDEGVVKILF